MAEQSKSDDRKNIEIENLKQTLDIVTRQYNLLAQSFLIITNFEDQLRNSLIQNLSLIIRLSQFTEKDLPALKEMQRMIDDLQKCIDRSKAYLNKFIDESRKREWSLNSENSYRVAAQKQHEIFYKNLSEELVSFKESIKDLAATSMLTVNNLNIQFGDSLKKIHSEVQNEISELLLSASHHPFYLHNLVRYVNELQDLIGKAGFIEDKYHKVEFKEQIEQATEEEFESFKKTITPPISTPSLS